MSVVAQKYVVNANFKGMPKRSDLRVEEESLPAIKDGGLLSILSFNDIIAISIINLVLHFNFIYFSGAGGYNEVYI